MSVDSVKPNSVNSDSISQILGNPVDRERVLAKLAQHVDRPTYYLMKIRHMGASLKPTDCEYAPAHHALEFRTALVWSGVVWGGRVVRQTVQLYGRTSLESLANSLRSVGDELHAEYMANRLEYESDEHRQRVARLAEQFDQVTYRHWKGRPLYPKSDERRD